MECNYLHVRMKLVLPPLHKDSHACSVSLLTSGLGLVGVTGLVGVVSLVVGVVTLVTGVVVVAVVSLILAVLMDSTFRA